MTNSFFRLPPVEPGPRKLRMVIVAVVFASTLVGLMVRAWYLQVHRHEDFVRRSAGNHQTTIELRASRGAIYDRNGHPLALSAMVPSVYAVPRQITDPHATATALTRALRLPASDLARLVKRLSTKRAFTWVKRQLTDRAEIDAVKALGIEGIALQNEARRFYPARSVAGALLGFAGIDGVGLEGVERDYDRYLRGRAFVLDGLRDAAGRKAMPGGAVPTDHLTGYSLLLTLDHHIQQVAEQVLRDQVAEMDAADGEVVVLDPRTGDILALAQTPDFDPNLFRTESSDRWRLRAITDVLEPGSTVKPLLVAAAFDAGRARPDTVWDGHKGRFKVGRKWITDVHPEERLTTLDIVMYSSNVGAVQVAQRLGKDAWHRYLRAFGFGQPTGLGLRGEIRGALRSPKRWGQIHLATFAYGYGFSVTPLQMARAVGALANGGVMMKPRLVREVRDATGDVVERIPPRVQHRVVSAQAARDATRAMERVTGDHGTGKRARVPGYRVAGKTGTANMVGPGGYSKDKVRSSFVGFVPAQDPRLVIYVTVREPRAARYGGIVAAPIFARIAEKALPYLGVEATEPLTIDDEVADDDGWDATTAGLDAQARAWWFEEAVLTGAPSHLVVPDFRRQPLREVVAKAASMDLELVVEGAGVVVSQRPQPGALLPRDGTLRVTLELPGTPPKAALAAVRTGGR